MARAGDQNQQMSSSGCNGGESDLCSDIDEDKQTKPEPKPFRRCNACSRCRIHSNHYNQESGLHQHQLAVAEQQETQNIYRYDNQCIHCACFCRAKKSGSNRPAKYTSRPCLAPSISNVAAVVVTLQQQQLHHSISAAFPRYSNCYIQWSFPPHHNIIFKLKKYLRSKD